MQLTLFELPLPEWKPSRPCRPVTEEPQRWFFRTVEEREAFVASRTAEKKRKKKAAAA